MSATVKIPAALRNITSNQSELSVAPGTLREVINHIDASHQGFKDRVLNTAGDINTWALIFVNDNNVHEGEKLETIINSGDEVLIIPMASGGR